jgi:hypothetical protein
MLLRYGNLNLGYGYFITINYLSMRKRYSEIFFLQCIHKRLKGLLTHNVFLLGFEFIHNLKLISVMVSFCFLISFFSWTFCFYNLVFLIFTCFFSLSLTVCHLFLFFLFPHDLKSIIRFSLYRGILLSAVNF